MAPPRQAELPAIGIYTDDEPVDPKSVQTAPRELTRTLHLAIEGWLSAADEATLEDAFDALALEIETAMDADESLDRNCYWSILESTETGIKLDGERPMGVVRLTYAIQYHTDLRTQVQDDARDDLVTAGVTYDLSGAQEDADQTQDLIEDLDT